ncbi:MAG: hypothetical protein ABJQ85_09475 [Rhizobiaceae bacterium]
MEEFEQIFSQNATYIQSTFTENGATKALSVSELGISLNPDIARRSDAGVRWI